MKNRAALLLLLLIQVVALGQQPTSSATPSVSWPKVPVAQITFKDDESLPAVPNTSPVLEYPIQCGSGGRYFVDMVLPPDFTKKQLYSVSKSQGLIKYSLDAVNGLHDISVNAYSPIPSGALILATATAGSEERHYIVRGQDGRQHDVTVHAGEHLSYLLRFDGNGAFRAAVPIDNGIRLSRVAMFTSGTYVGIGTTRSDSSLHLMLLDENGTLSRLLDPPDELADIARKGMHSLHGAAGATPWVQFVPGPEKILMVPLHSRGTVFEIRPGGEITALKLKLPKGLVVGALVPATDHLYAWIASANDGDDLESARLYEFDQNGSIVRELEPIGASPGEIACKQDGSFVAFRLDNDAKLIALKAGD